ncbi:hypothetical protein JTE90_005017 [Oedothorax gibbosus]|uniref:HIT-type domain-containing protein n=1 Tax=Oedothorax gibbosus TaxID=931172 RepID=A0AAV6VCK1_9ARAC|nr:hypothetical protein JTE90_005017 [Oedothorax gibbosus]
MENLLKGKADSPDKDTPIGAVFQNPCSSCKAPSKYRCPKCSAFSCSLGCVKAHKAELKCDGVRDRSAFVPIDEFKDRHLLSDYQYLEDIGRTIDNVTRAKRHHGFMGYLPQNLYRMKRAANERKTNLQILPLLFAKRKENTTFFRYSDQKIFWRIKWLFPQSDFTCYDVRIDEETLLGTCLDKYLIPESSDTADSNLVLYKSFGHKGVTVLIRDENCPANQTKYLALKQNKSLKVNFAGKKITEFPTLLVVPNIHLSCYLD